MIQEEMKIVTAKTANMLTNTVNNLINVGWKRVGSHHVVTTHAQNRYAGKQHMDTVFEVEYSQTMVREIDSEMEEYKPNN